MASHRRLLYSINEAAEMLGIGVRTLRNHVSAGDIQYVLVGKRTKKFEESDLKKFIESRKELLCPSTSRKVRRTDTTTSGSRVFDFTAAREQRISAQRRT